MKRTLITVVLVVMSLVAFSQESTDKYSLELPKDNMLEVNGGFLLNSVVRFKSNKHLGTAENGNGFSVGITYSRKLTDKLWVGGGYNYMELTNDYNSVSLPVIVESKTAKIWSIPIHVRYSFTKWAYIKPGFAFDFQYNNKEGEKIDNQSGVSVYLAAGVNFKVWKSMYVAFEPKVGVMSLAAFKGDDYQQHFIVYGATINLSYLF